LKFNSLLFAEQNPVFCSSEALKGAGTFKSRATFLRIIAANLSGILMAQELPSQFGRICNPTTMSVSICNARKIIGLQILILNSVELQIALPFGQRPLVRQNGKNRPKMPLMPP